MRARVTVRTLASYIVRDMGFPLGWLSGQALGQLGPIVRTELAAEVHQAIENIRGLEVCGTARDVDEAAGIEAAFLEEGEADAPGATRDRFAAVAAIGLALRALRSVEALQARLRDAR